jgi:hypothetical protein
MRRSFGARPDSTTANAEHDDGGCVCLRQNRPLTLMSDVRFLFKFPFLGRITSHNYLDDCVAPFGYFYTLKHCAGTLKNFEKNYLGGSKCDFASAAGTAAGVAIMTSVAQTVCEFGFETQLTSGVQLRAGFPLVFAPLSDGFFQELNFVCLPPARTSNSN